jgi:tetratricopeptide (TPR) repeat protein
MKEILLVGFQFILLCTAFCHGNLEERIVALTEEIAKDPTNSLLYFKRGQLYQQHEEPDRALADYLKAEVFGCTNKVLFFRQAEIYLKLRFFHSGIISTEKYLQEDPFDIKIHKLRGALFRGMEDHDNAISAFRFVIEKTRNLSVSKTGIRPENFLQLSEAYLEKDSSLVDSALMVIEDGLSILGEKVFFLQLKKLDYLKIQGNEEKILHQFDYFIESSDRKEKWYFRKAKFLFDQKEYSMANESLKCAISSYQKLPLRIQKTKAIIKLNDEINILKHKIIIHENLPNTEKN